MAVAATKATNRTRCGHLRAALSCLFLCLVVAATGFGQPSQSAAVESAAVAPIDTETGFLQNQGALPRFQAAGKLCGDTLTATLQQRISSVPHFSGSFGFEGKTFPFTVVGNRPQVGGTTQIPT